MPKAASLDKELSRELRRLNDRIERIETRLGGLDVDPKDYSDLTSGIGYCSLPNVPERVFDRDVSEHRERLIRYIDRKWFNGT